MTSVSIAARFDGTQIVLDEAIELEANARLIVTVLPEQSSGEHAVWTTLSQQGLANAYGDYEIEYGIDSIKDLNSAYEGR